MASAELSRRVEKVVGYPPLSDLGDLQRREFHEALLDAGSFEDLPGKWQAAILEAAQTGRSCGWSPATRHSRPLTTLRSPSARCPALPLGRSVSPCGGGDDDTLKLSVLAVGLTADLRKRFVRLAKDNDRTVQQEIRAALGEHVAREAE